MEYAKLIQVMGMTTMMTMMMMVVMVVIMEVTHQMMMTMMMNLTLIQILSHASGVIQRAGPVENFPLREKTS